MNKQCGIYQNGLTSEQVAAARELFSKVSLKRVCEECKVPPSTIYNVLRDNSSRVDLLKKVIDTAQVHKAEREKILKSIPV